MKLHLFSGAGNTFHIVSESMTLSELDTQKLVKDLCGKYPADGFIYLSQVSPENFEWNFFNNDGSRAEMCGNATRCVGSYIKNILKNELNHYNLKTIAGNIEIQVITHDIFEIAMTPIQKMYHPKYFYCDTGVPHIVFETSQFSNYTTLKQLCSDLRFHSDFLPRGTNVTLVEFNKASDQLKAVTFERGVEDFTLACGTGAVAAAFYNFEKRTTTITEVQMPGGTLQINLKNLSRPLMRGPAILKGEFNVNSN